MNSKKKGAAALRIYLSFFSRICAVFAVVYFVCSLQLLPATAEQETEDEISRALASRNQSFSPDDAILTMTGSKPLRQEAVWTVMIYMIGSNLESRLGNGTKDLMEMDQAGVDYSRSNILVYAGGSRRWVGNMRADCNGIYDLSQSGEERLVARTEKNASMGASQTLESFLSFCCEEYPAEHYALILWDHGGGPIWGYGSDELFGDDSLLLREMKQAMEAGPFRKGSGKKLDFIGFDACLMGSLECMKVWQPYARYYIGSEELEPGDGWDYHFLNVLNSSDDPGEVTQHIVESFRDYYEGIRTDYYDPDITLSCIDLSKLDGLMSAFTDLLGRMVSWQSEGGYMALRRMREGTRSFGSPGGEDEDAFSYELTDLGHLAQGIAERFPQESSRLQQALDETVTAVCSNMEHASGVAFYYPAKDKTQYRMTESVYGDTGMPSLYKNYLDGLASRWLKEDSSEWKLEPAALEGEFYRLPLTLEQQEDTVSASCSVLVPYANDRYYPVVENIPLETDEDGKVLIPQQFTVFCIETGDSSRQLFRTVHMYDEEERNVYRSSKLGLMNDVYYADRIANASSLHVQFQLACDRNTGEVSICDITQTDLISTAGAGKNNVELDGWEALYSAIRPLDPAYGKSGVLLPYTQWSKGDSMFFIDYPLEDGFSLISCGTQDMEQDFYVQVILSDGSGNEHAGQLIRLEHKEFQSVAEATENGTLEYTVYDDHAAVTGYTGSDEELTILPEIEGVPVTEIADSVFFRKILDAKNDYVRMRHISLPDTIRRIGRNAFANCRDLEEIILPDDLQTIGEEAFSDCRSLKEIRIPEGVRYIGKCAFAFNDCLEQITLPSTVEVIGAGVLMGTPSLEKITLDQGNEAFTLADGMLVRKEGNTLLALPAAQSGTLVIPEGIEEIAYGAGQNAQFSALEFPEGLKRIGNFAFYDCPGAQYMQELVLPDSLESIGSCAFGTGIWGLDVPEEKDDPAWDVTTQIRIGKNAVSISEDAFSGIASRYFTVDPDNTFYTGVQGSLANGAGDSLVCARTRIRGREVIIPEGIVTFDWTQIEINDMLVNPFNFASKDMIINLFLPSTMVHFPADADGGNGYCVHCPLGSEAERFALEHKMQVSHLLQPDYETAELTTDDNMTLSFRIYGEEAVLTGCSGTGRVLRIPEEIQGAVVTGVGDGKVPVINDTQPCENLGQVIFPESLTQVNAYAFRGVDASFSDLPEGLLEIGDQAFHYSGCTLSHLPAGIQYLGEGCIDLEGLFTVTPQLKYIAPNAFQSWQFEGYTQEGDNPFYSVEGGVLFSADKTKLLSAPSALREEYKVPEGTVSIGAHAFSGNGYLRVIEFPEGLERIDEYAFYDCDSLETVLFSEGLRQIGGYAFYDCKKLNNLDFPTSLEKIGTHAFSSCSALDTAAFSEGLTEIGSYAFSETPFLLPERLPDSLEKIGSNAFANRWSDPPAGEIAQLYLGSSLETFEVSAFSSQPILSFAVSQENQQFSAVEGFLTDSGGTSLIMIPPGLKGTVEIPDGITRIRYGAVSELGRCTHIRLPDSVTSVDQGAIPSEVIIVE